ncbi:MAG: hypothetical protein QOJ38_1194, partial [Solirubrobacterales bacterium]|nr:hypothetical protein [Solirubrobacterales bacterium]
MEEGRAQSRRSAGTLLALALAAAALVATTARAADPALPVNPGDPTSQIPQDPGQACQDQVDKTPAGSTTQGAGCDNNYTPIAKDGTKLSWAQWAGSVYPGATKPTGYDDTVQNQKAPIPPTVDFYTVSFANSRNGFAGGSQCREDASPQNHGESNKDYQDRITPFLNTCERVPVIYRYTDNSQFGPIWQPSYKGDTPGFVGAISWLHNLDNKAHGQRVLAVGGSGSPNANCPQVAANPPYEGNPPYPSAENPTCGGYPRREPAIPSDVTDPKDCAQEGAKNANAADINPDGHKPGLVPGTGSTVLGQLPTVDSSQSVITPRDVREARALCEDRWRQDHDAAGKGRAWLFSDGDWQDLGTPGNGLPRGMRGMIALDAATDVVACGTPSNECAMAGALQQIWMWQDGAFDPKPWRPDPSPDAPSKAVVRPELAANGTTDKVTNASSPCKSSWNCQWHYRMRAVNFGALGNAATAVMSGCCSSLPDPDASNGRAMVYSKDRGTWGAFITQQDAYGLSVDSLALGDSYYAVAGSPDGSYLVTSGGPERVGERPSQIVHVNYTTVKRLAYDAFRPWVSSARLVAGDGDFQNHQLTLADRLAGGAAGSNDGFIDWAVGGLRGARRGVAYTTTARTFGLTNGGNTADGPNIDAPFPVACPGNRTPAQDNATKCQPNDKAAEQAKSGYLFNLSSYFLNDFTFAAESGIGWGVGDRGAIERLGGNEAGAGGTLQKESAPALGAKRAAPAPPRQPYESTKPSLTTDPGEVPARASQPLEKLSAPKMTSYGSPNPHGDGESVNQVVMSRDGSEGWAIGPFSTIGQILSAQMTLFHFDAGRWRRCGTDSVEGVIKADPACEALWPLAHFDSTGVQLTAIARIPMENSSDPTKADDFEVIAAGTPDKTGREPVLRYHDGRWAVDETWTDQLNPVGGGPPGPVTDLAFSSPNDGWIVAGGNP